MRIVKEPELTFKTLTFKGSCLFCMCAFETDLDCAIRQDGIILTYDSKDGLEFLGKRRNGQSFTCRCPVCKHGQALLYRKR